MRRLSAFVVAALFCGRAAGTDAVPVLTTRAGGGPNNMPALAANLKWPKSAVVDRSGNIYISVDRMVLKVASTGQLTILAGHADAPLGNDIPAYGATLSDPRGLALDAAGNIYIADWRAGNVRRVDARTGLITAPVGALSWGGFYGDGGPAVNARLLSPEHIVFDGAGNLYIADAGNNRIRKVDAATQVIRTVAGNGTTTDAGDGGLAVDAGLSRPNGVAVDPAGNLYIADTQHHRVRRVDAVTGIITTVAGTGTTGYSGDGGPATLAALNSPSALSLDSSGRLYIAAVDHVRRIEADGTISTFAGNPSTANLCFRPATDGMLAPDYPLHGVSDVFVDAADDVYILQAGCIGRALLLRVNAATAAVTTVAGNGSMSTSGDGGPATDASIAPTNVMFMPAAMALDNDGGVLIGGGGTRVLRRVDLSTGLIQRIAGVGEHIWYPPDGDGGPALQAGGDFEAIAVDSANHIYTSSFSGRLRRIDGQTGIITTIAGRSNASQSTSCAQPGQLGTQTDLCNATYLDVDAAGNVFFVEWSSKRILRLDHATGLISVVVNQSATQGKGGDGGPAIDAQLNKPYGLAVDRRNGDIYVIDGGDATLGQEDRIRRIHGQTGIISTYIDDVPWLMSIAFAMPGTLYIASAGYIHRHNLTTGWTAKIAGTGGGWDNRGNPTGEGGPALEARIHPVGVAARDGVVYVYDSWPRVFTFPYSDSTPPTTTATLTPSPNASGWAHGEVKVELTSSDGAYGTGVRFVRWSVDGGPMAEAEGPTAEFTVSGDGPHGFSFHASDGEGNLESDQTVGFRIDTALPALQSCDGPDGAWHASDVTFACTFTDALSGPAAQTLTFTTSVPAGSADANAPAQTTGMACDAAGNCLHPAPVAGAKVDREKPATTVVAKLADGTTYVAGTWAERAVTLTLNGSDGSGSGVARIAYTLSGAQSGSGTIEGASGSVTIAVGGTTTLSFHATDVVGNAETARSFVVRLDNTPPVLDHCDPAAGWHGDNVTVRCYYRDAVSPPVVTVTLATHVTAGTEDANASATTTEQVCDAAGNCTPAALVAGLKIDRKAPAITATATAGGSVFSAGDWTNQNVTVTFACVDGGSGVASSAAPVTLGAEGAGLSATGACRDAVGNIASASFAGIHIDRTPPHAPVVAVAPLPNAAGWNASEPVVTFAPNGDDGVAQSGVAGCTSATRVTAETAGTLVAGTCTDRAGNVGPPASVTVKLDATPPAVAVTGVTDGAAYVLGAAPAPACSTSDALSGVAASATISVTGANANGAGPITATCAGAADVAGNPAAPVSVTYTVKYALTGGGFLPPFGGSTTPVFKAGSTVPLKFQLKDGNGNDVTDVNVVQAIEIGPAQCDTGAYGTPFDPGASGNSGLRYDATTHQFIYNWQTKGVGAGCYVIILRLDDSSVYTTPVVLK